MNRAAAILVLSLLSGASLAQVEPGFVNASISGPTEQPLSMSIQILITMTLLTLLPAAVLSTSAFMRIVIVLSILRQALGTAQTPPNQVLLGVSLFLTFFVMSPVIDTVWADSVQPYMDNQITAQAAFDKGVGPLRGFMLDQTRDSDIQLFAGISGHQSFQSVDEIPTSIVVPSFMVSELKTAFQVGFMIFIPFLVIDLVVSSVLMSMGMMMLSPMIISLPFKIMLFVLVDGWAMILGSLAASFYT